MLLRLYFAPVLMGVVFERFARAIGISLAVISLDS